ncbi:MAG: acyl-CoA dehydrogenase [Ruminococcaceae bacterium]|nr:acyl-CoA dehydrogenase [Oscillospiraceae bacterium]
MKTSYNLLTDEQQELRLMVREFADKEIIPGVKDLDVAGEFPHELYRKAFDMGLTTMTLPEQYGGMGLDIFTYSLLKEEIARGDAGFAGAIAGCFMGSLPALLSGTDYHKNLVAECLNNGGVMAFCLTEPDSGSDSASMRTTYVDDGDSYVMNGRKCFISNGGVADLLLVFATKDRSLGNKGISCFLVETKSAGVSVGKHEDKLGYRTSATTDIIFEDCRVPKANLIGAECEGMAIMNRSLNRTRPTAGAGAIGNAQYAYECAVDYAKVRTSFGGKPICKFQGVGFMLADMYTQLEAARQMVWHACRCADAGVVDRKLFSAAKCFAADVGMNVCTNAVQVLGGYGYSREYPVEKRFRDAKIYQIFEGTNQIQRVIINSDICKD